MKKNILIILTVLAALAACTEKDMTPPEILPVGDYASPLNCQEFARGAVLPFAYLFTDDTQLGSFNIEVHNNFDHHTHSTEAEECKEDPAKEPVNPWIFNQDYPIPAGHTSHEALFDIPIPEDADPGLYHFMIRVTDASGWQQIRSVSIRLI